MILLFTVKQAAHEIGLVLIEFGREMRNVQEKHKTASRLLIGFAAGLTSCAVPFTVPSDAKVRFCLWITKHLLGSRLSEFSRRLLIIPLIPLISTCFSFTVLECIFNVIFATVGSMHTVKNCCSSINNTNKFKLNYSLQIKFCTCYYLD